MGLVREHNAVTPMRLDPAVPRSRVKHCRLPPSHCAPISRHEAAKMMNPCPAEYSRDIMVISNNVAFCQV